MLNYSTYIPDDLPFEEKDRIMELIYLKIRNAVENKHTFVILFTLGGKDDWEKGYSAIIDDLYYDGFLKNYLQWSSDLERYEECVEINNIIKKLEIWKKQN